MRGYQEIQLIFIILQMYLTKEKKMIDIKGYGSINFHNKKTKENKNFTFKNSITSNFQNLLNWFGESGGDVEARIKCRLDVILAVPPAGEEHSSTVEDTDWSWRRFKLFESGVTASQKNSTTGTSIPLFPTVPTVGINNYWPYEGDYDPTKAGTETDDAIPYQELASTNSGTELKVNVVLEPASNNIVTSTEVENVSYTNAERAVIRIEPNLLNDLPDLLEDNGDNNNLGTWTNQSGMINTYGLDSSAGITGVPVGIQFYYYTAGGCDGKGTTAGWTCGGQAAFSPNNMGPYRQKQTGLNDDFYGSYKEKVRELNSTYFLTNYESGRHAFLESNNVYNTSYDQVYLDANDALGGIEYQFDITGYECDTIAHALVGASGFTDNDDLKNRYRVTNCKVYGKVINGERSPYDTQDNGSIKQRGDTMTQNEMDSGHDKGQFVWSTSPNQNQTPGTSTITTKNKCQYLSSNIATEDHNNLNDGILLWKTGSDNWYRRDLSTVDSNWVIFDKLLFNWEWNT